MDPDPPLVPVVPADPLEVEPGALEVPLVPGVDVTPAPAAPPLGPAVPVPALCAMAIVEAAASATAIKAFLLSMR
jgi:hypothetical protein